MTGGPTEAILVSTAMEVSSRPFKGGTQEDLGGPLIKLAIKTLYMTQSVTHLMRSSTAVRNWLWECVSVVVVVVVVVVERSSSANSCYSFSLASHQQ